MKKRTVIICICVPVLLFALFVAYKYIERAEKYIVRGDIVSAEVRRKNDINVIYTDDKEQIEVLLSCIWDVSYNNDGLNILPIDQSPFFYSITFEFSDGHTELREYRVYPAKHHNDPFKPFYGLFSENE